MPLVNSISNGTESIAFLCPKVGELVPEEVKQKEYLNAFQGAIKNDHQQTVPVDYAKTFYMVYDFCSEWTL